LRALPAAVEASKKEWPQQGDWQAVFGAARAAVATGRAAVSESKLKDI